MNMTNFYSYIDKIKILKSYFVDSIRFYVSGLKHYKKIPGLFTEALDVTKSLSTGL